MASIIQYLLKQSVKLIHPPNWLGPNLAYETYHGSHAYGTADTNKQSDCDIYGFCIPPKGIIFPNLSGVIFGFGNQGEKFDQWQQHHVKDTNKNKEYDFSVYNIVRYFQLLIENNPNMLDSLYTHETCVTHCTQVGQYVRSNKKLFLSKLIYIKYRSYAYSQLKKMRTKTPDMGSARRDLFDKFGFDIKYGSHLVRLLLQCEQVFTNEDMDLRRDCELIKSIKKGEWTTDKIEDFFDKKASYLEDLHNKSTLPDKPDEDKVKNLLLECLEMHYGSLKDCIVNPDKDKVKLQKIREILDS